MLFYRMQCLGSAICLYCGIALFFEMVADELLDIAFILHHKNRLLVFHTNSVSNNGMFFLDGRSGENEEKKD
jgi:hypothetical protein